MLLIDEDMVRFKANSAFRPMGNDCNACKYVASGCLAAKNDVVSLSFLFVGLKMERAVQLVLAHDHKAVKAVEAIQSDLFQVKLKSLGALMV